MESAADMTLPAIALPELRGSDVVPADASVHSHQWLANTLRCGANALSLSRVVLGAAVGYQIGASQYPTESVWPMLEVTGLAATDYGDGRLAGLATAVDGKRSKLGAWLDQLADKVFVAAIIGGVACGSFASGRTEAGIIVAATGAVFVARDLYVTRKRMLAERANRGINTGAKWHGKAKTAMQFGALTALSSPAMEYAPASWGAIGLLVGAAGMSVYSALQYRRSLGQEIAATTAQE